MVKKGKPISKASGAEGGDHAGLITTFLHHGLAASDAWRTRPRRAKAKAKKKKKK